MPRSEQDVARDEFEQALSRDANETENTGPSRDRIRRPTQHFEAYHSSQSVRNPRQTAQSALSDERRCHQGCEKAAGTGRRDEGKALRKTSMAKLRIGEEEGEGIKNKVVTGDMDERMRE